MISIIPALQFMQSLVGDYRSDQAQEQQIIISGCGYGQIFEHRSGGKTVLAGAIGAWSDHVELCALIGLPNIVYFDGRLLSAKQIVFQARDLPIQFELTRTAVGLDLLFKLDGKAKEEHCLVRLEP